jgi:Zn-dependent protease with chaperone function
LPRATSAAGRATSAYRLEIALAATGLLLSVGAVGDTLATVSTRSRPPHVVSTFGLHVALPSANPAAIALLVLATLGIAVLLAVLRGVFAIARAHRRLQRGLLVVGQLPGDPGVEVFAYEGIQAFCAGLLHPRIYISAGALRELGDGELQAVLAHEQMHRSRHDPLRVVTARLLGEALFFAPAVRSLARRYDTLAEIAADDHALAAVGDDASVVASAMLAFDADVAPERADHILGLPGDWALPLGLSGMTLAGVGALAVLVWQLGRHAVLQTTLGLPLVSPAPCVVVLALVPLSALALGMWASRRF